MSAAEPGANTERDTERDTDMTTTYVRVMVLEAAILIALWAIGRIFA